MWSNLILFLAAFHIQIAQPLAPTHELAPQLIVWNVGQGQWATMVQADHCLHFDMGGEKFDLRQVERFCGDRPNFAFFSHWDQDHLSFVHHAARMLKNFCIVAMPAGPCPSAHKQKLFDGIPRCNLLDAKLEEIDKDPQGQHLTSNDYSRVFEYAHWVIAQGDSPLKEEKVWAKSIDEATKVHAIVLGHHGSRTSTSENLLRTLPGLRIAISSARMARYGHPHAEVLKRLRKFGVACLRTEEWGNIHIEAR